MFYSGVGGGPGLAELLSGLGPPPGLESPCLFLKAVVVPAICFVIAAGPAQTSLSSSPQVVWGPGGTGVGHHGCVCFVSAPEVTGVLASALLLPQQRPLLFSPPACLRFLLQCHRRFRVILLLLCFVLCFQAPPASSPAQCWASPAPGAPMPVCAEAIAGSQVQERD